MSLICPKCEAPLDEHVNGCPKRLSRRFFLGALGTAFGAAVLAKALPTFSVAPAKEGEILVAAAPKVHEASALVFNYTGYRDLHVMKDIARIAAREHRQAIIRIGGVVAAHYDSNGLEIGRG